MMCPSNKMTKTCPGENISIHILQQAINQQMTYITKNKKEFLNLVKESLEKQSRKTHAHLIA